MNVFEWIKDNATTIKDICTIIFTATGTILAILTYRRAKSTILQPKRTEVIKKQTEILTNFLTLVTKNHNSIDTGLDYINLFGINVDLVLRDFGLLEINILSEKYLEYDSLIAGWIEFLENDIYKFVFIKGNLSEYDRLVFNEHDGIRQKLYNAEARSGKVIVHRIFFTHKHQEFYEALRDFWSNPFLPKEIHEATYQIGVNIILNVHSDLRNLLTKLIIEYIKALENDSENKIVLSHDYRHQDLYRVYEKVKKSHDLDFKNLKEKIRNHLEIDKKW